MEIVGLLEKNSTREKVYVLRHAVTFSETNAMGGVVYFSNFVKWQGVARELILCQKIEYKKLMSSSLEIITHSCSAKFLEQLYFGDVARIEVQTRDVLPTSLVIQFRYFDDKTDKLVATGEQKVAFADGKKGELCRIPPEIQALAKEVEILATRSNKKENL